MKRILSLIISSLALMSCESFLNEEVFTTVDSKEFYKTEKELESGLVAAYATFQDVAYYDNLIFQIADVSTDMLDSRWANNVYDRYNDDAGQTQYRAFWEQCWVVNNAINAVIVNAPNVKMSDESYSRIVGEARFLRALNYFNLARCYGAVPIQLNFITSVNDDLYPHTQSLDAVYSQIISDLLYAKENLNTNAKVFGSSRVTKGAAAALLGKVYLTRAGFFKNEAGDALIQVESPTEYYTRSYQILDSLKNGHFGTYDLFEDYADVFNNEYEDGVEHIFSIHFKQGELGLGVGEGSLKQTHFAPQNFGITHSAYGTYRSTAGFYKKFAANDTRRPVAFLDKFIDQNGITQIYEPGAPASLPYPYVRKYLRAIREGGEGGFDTSTARDGEENTIILRYADVLLMHSEAAYYAKGKTVDADVVEGINKVRVRAGLTALSATSDLLNTEAKFITEILNERDKELCFEGHGWFDYVRTGTLYDRVAKLANKANKTKYYTWPIPGIELNKNPNITQSPTW